MVHNQYLLAWKRSLLTASGCTLMRVATRRPIWQPNP